MNIYPSIIKEQYEHEIRRFDVDELNLPNINQLAEWLCHNCKPYFSQTFKPVYRGIVLFDPQHIVSTSPVRKDRKPLHSDPVLHETADKAFEHVFGYKFRSGSIFVTGDSNDASTYGMNHIVIPIGEFVYCWSPNVYDFYTYSDEVKIPINISVEEMATLIKTIDYKTTNLDEAISSEYEIMIYCDSFVKIRMDNRRILQYVQKVFDTVKENLNG